MLLNSTESFTSFDMQGLEKMSFFWFEEGISRVLASAYDRQGNSVSVSCCQ